MVGEVKRSYGFAFVVTLGLASACGGTVETRSASGNVETDGGGTGGTNGASGSPGGGRSGNSGFPQGGSSVAGTGPIDTGGVLIGSCNPLFCQPEGPARGCCVTMNGPCGVDYGDGCAARGCDSPGGCITPLPLPTCTDGLVNGAETDVDCGGGLCPKCTTGRRCLVNSDCASLVCAGALCLAPSCADGVRNGDEICVDCGGSCPACSNCPAD